MAQWLQLAGDQRNAWLSDEGYSASELQDSLACCMEMPDVDPDLGTAIERFLLAGVEIPSPLRPVLGEHLLERLRRLDALAGGSKAGFVFSNKLLLTDYKSARGVVANGSRLLQEASETQLARYIEVVGGVEDEVASHITHQVDTEVLEVKGAVDSKASSLISFKAKEQSAYQTRQQRFITQTADEAVTAESNAIAKDNTARADGQHPLQQDFAQSGGSRPTLGNKEQTVIQDDKAYFDAHDLVTLQSGLVTKPTWTVSGEGRSRSVTLTYDWNGTRGTVQLDRAFAQAELDPALGALNRLTAHALWSARQSAAIASWESQLWPQWQARLAKAHPKLANQLATTVHAAFPKAKLPTSYSQLLRQEHDAAAAAQATLHKRVRRAWRHGVTLDSLQRQWDEKRLEQHTTLLHLAGLASQGARTGDAALRTAVGRQLQAMALSVLLTDVQKQLAASGKGQALRNMTKAIRGRAATFAASDATGEQALRAGLAQSSTTLSVSDGDVDLRWTVGTGIQFSSKGQDSSAAGSTTDPTLSLQSQSKDDSQDSLRLSASLAPSGTLSTSYYRSSDGGNVRQFSNSYTLSSNWQLRLKRGQAFGVAELQAYKASLTRAARQDASADLQQHSAALENHERLDLFVRSTLKTAGTLHRALHDLRVDRRIEARIKPVYGSVRSQKLLLNQLQHDRAMAVHAVGTLRHIRTVKSLLRHDASLTRIEWDKGVLVDQDDLNTAKKIYKTKPLSVEKNGQGSGYHLAKTGTHKDYWQTLTEKQKYAIFNPIYHSEAIFYKSERAALLAGVGEYTTLRRDGASKKMARLGASATFFNTLLREDAVLYREGLAQAKLAYAPFILRRQLRLAKHVVHLIRHPFAWRLRLSWKVKRERFIHKHVAAYEQYMLNHKFTGFHPFHRIARKSTHLIKSTWHYVLHPIVHRLGRVTLGVISIFSPSAAKWVGNAATKVFKGAVYLAYHAAKALWHLPEHLYHHTIYFGKQLLFAVSHPWEYRVIWTGLKKDFRGIYRLAKFAEHLIGWAGSSFFRTLYQLSRWMTGQGANWSSIVRGAYHKKLWHKAKMLHDAWRFAGLATLIGKTKATRVAIKVEVLRMQLRRDLHHDGFLVSPWRRFVRQHKSFVRSQFDDIKPSQTAAVFAAYQRERASLHRDKKSLLKDYAKYKINATYRANVQAQVAEAKARAASLSSKLKPAVKAAMHTLSQDVLRELSNVTDKNHKIRILTVRAYDRDLTQVLWAANRYRHLGSLGRKEVLLAFVAFKDLNRTHKSGVIKTTLQAYNHGVLSKYKTWKKYFQTGTSTKGTYAYAVFQDWLNVGQQIGGQLLMALQFSFKSGSAGKSVAKDIRNAKLGEHIFDDIMGGFWLDHYERGFAAKNASLIAATKGERQLAKSRLQTLEMVVTQPPVHKLLAYWLKRNTNSVVARDMRFGRALEKKIHKWERIEKIGHYEVSEQDILSLQSLHKSQMLGASLAEAVARTSQWQELSLQRQAVDRDKYDNWLAYNQTTYHGLDKSYSKFQQKDPSEAAAWQSEQAEIAAGQSLSVGSLLVSVRTNDTKRTKWTTTPKPSLANSTQHLEAAAANLVTLSHDPQLLALSVVTHAPDHSGTTPVKPNPSLWAYIMQIRHWSHKIKKKLADRDAKKAKAEEEAKKAKEAEAKAKEEAEADETAAKQQLDAAKLQLEDGSKDRQQLAFEARQDDASAGEKLKSDNRLDRLGRQVVRSDSSDPARQLQQLEDGTLKSDQQELQQVELHEEARVERELRQAADEDPELRDLRDALRVDSEVRDGDFKKDTLDDAKQLGAPEEQRIQKDLRDDTADLTADAEADLESTLADSSELLDETVQEIKVDTELLEDEAVEVEETGVEVAELA